MKKTATPRRSIRTRALLRLSLGATTAGVLACGCLQPALAGPQNPQVAAGSATFATHGNLTTIQAGNNAIINYSAFNIASQETVQFIQPSASARVLNRITGSQPTTVAGGLLANGQVYFVNPNGIYFTSTAMINVGGIYAVAGSLANADFLHGADHFTNLAGSVVNQGAMAGQAIHLIGTAVSNTGSISADSGLITLIAGKDVYLSTIGGRCTVQVDGSNLASATSGKTAPNTSAAPGVENSGSLTASGGQVYLGAGDMYALAIRNCGRISADGGNITLAAHDGAVVNQGQLHADGANGQAGSVLLQGPTVLQQGSISADAASGPAGSIALRAADSLTVDTGSAASAVGNAAYPAGGSAEFSGHTVNLGAATNVSGFGSGPMGSLTVDPAGTLNLASDPGSGNVSLTYDVINVKASFIHTGNLTLNATFGSTGVTDAININSNFSITGNLTLNTTATGSINFFSALTGITGNLMVNAPLITFINTTNTPMAITTGNAQVYAGLNGALATAMFEGPINLTTSKASVNFSADLINSPATPCDLTISTGSGTFFAGDVGTSGAPLGSLTITSGQTNFDAPLSAANESNRNTPVPEMSVITIGNQSYGGTANFECDTTLTATNPGATVTFRADVEGQRQSQAGAKGKFFGDDAPNIIINAPGGTTFYDFVSEYFGTGQGFPVNDGSPNPLNGFQQQLIRSLTINGPTSFQVAPNGVSGSEVPQSQGPYVVTTYRQQVYNGPVTDEYTIQLMSMAGDIRFLGSLSATGDSQVAPDLSIFAPMGGIQFLGPVGAGPVAFRNITVQADANAGDTITINANGSAASPSFQASGDISLNQFNNYAVGVTNANGSDPNVSTFDPTTTAILNGWLGPVVSTQAGAVNGVPLVATIADPTGNLAFFAGGDFTVGGNNKITAANGSLTIIAGATATIGDLNAFTDMTVVAPTINFLTRSTGILSNPDQSPRSDYGANSDGVDIVANGSFTFSGAFSGAVIPAFGSPSLNPDPAGTLAAHHVSVIATDPAVTAAPFLSTVAGDMVFDSPRVLDMTIVLPAPPVISGSQVLAGPIPWVDRMVREALIGPPARTGMVADLSVDARDPNSTEYASCLQFVRLWNDLAAPTGGALGGPVAGQFNSGPLYASLGPTFFIVAPAPDAMPAMPINIEINRIRRAQALESLDHFRALFDPQNTGDAHAIGARAIQLRELFHVAWQTYAADAHGQPLNPAGFGRYLDMLPEASPLAQDVQQLKSLLASAYLTGYTQVEYANVVDAVLRPIVPQGLTVAGMYQALTGQTLRPTSTVAPVTARLSGALPGATE